MTDVYIGVAITVLILAVLFYVDQKIKYGKYSDDYKHKEPTLWSLGDRKNHPIWAWMVSAVLWSILIFVGYGTIQYMLYGHHGPHYASKLGLDSHGGEHKVASADGHGAVQGAGRGSAILEEVKREGKLEKNRHFHNLVEDSTLNDKNPICYLCHGNFPHKRRPFIRTMMNMHTQFVGCFTCHVTDIDESKITLKWENYSDNKPEGEPFGLAYNEDTGRLEITDDYYSKIIGFIDVGGQEQMLEIPEDSPLALEYLSIQSQLAMNPQLQGQFKNRIHKNVMPKGRFCTRCHTAEEESFIPYRKLGFSEERISDLTGLNIVGIVQKYKNFFIPSLYRGDDREDKETINKLVGKDSKVKPAAPKGPAFDPKAWWRQNYIKKEQAPEKTWQK
ncbi:MAG: hypothetical protein IMF07_06010 [Proteobacteria bacterium]|nr:hypothetical protein [Pseudomonadota bacterium]